MTRALLLASAAWLGFYGCARDPGPQPEGATSAGSASAMPLPPPPSSTLLPRPLDVGPPPEVAPPAEHERAVLALLSGELDAGAFPEVATEGAEGLDLELAAELAWRKKTKTAFESPSIKGPLALEALRLTLENGRPRLRGCYERGLARNPFLEGRVKLELSLLADGHVAAVEASGDIPDSLVMRCISQRARAFRFPPQDAPSQAGVTFSMKPS
ncbi:MAG: AgmX/PglI C-terminal domain-containing protein [Polyangiaceae bacterium]